jgi:hypothetical protein
VSGVDVDVDVMGSSWENGHMMDAPPDEDEDEDEDDQ